MGSGRQPHFTPTRTGVSVEAHSLSRSISNFLINTHHSPSSEICGNTMKKRLTLEEGLSILNGGIAKATMILDGYPTSALFTCEEYMKLYDCVYDMCVQHPPYEYCAELYDIFKKALENGITSRVIPAMKDKSHIFLLYELWNMWSKYKIMAKCLGGFFLYLDRYFVEDRKADSLSDLSISCFHDLVCIELYPKLLEAAICLINEDRDGNSVCRDLLKNVSTFFVEIGRENKHYYENFEAAVLSSTQIYYNLIVPQWLRHYSSADYVLKAEYCLSQEKERLPQFLHQTSVEKLLRVVHGLLLGQTVSKLHEKQKAECGGDSVSYQACITGTGTGVSGIKVANHLSHPKRKCYHNVRA